MLFSRARWSVALAGLITLFLIAAQGDETRPIRNQIDTIKTKNALRHAPGSRQRFDDTRVNQAKVIAPLVAPGMEQWHDGARVRIERTQVAALVAITVHAGQAEVFLECESAMLFRINVVDFVRDANTASGVGAESRKSNTLSAGVKFGDAATIFIPQLSHNPICAQFTRSSGPHSITHLPLCVRPGENQVAYEVFWPYALPLGSSTVDGPIRRRDVLGGLIHDYYRAA